MRSAEALIIVDVQNDFLPGGALAVPGGDGILPVVRSLAARFSHVFATRDWHPADHGSFAAQGGPWPEHCVAGTPGADLSASLDDIPNLTLINKGKDTTTDGYSAFEADYSGTDDLHEKLGRVWAFGGGGWRMRLTVCGLATDYCVKATVLDALRRGYAVNVITDGIAGIDPLDAGNAVLEMMQAGAIFLTSGDDAARA
jgi:nicotinamidase/pyrazinamidase